MSSDKFDRPAIKLHTGDVLTLQNIGGQWKKHESGPDLSLVWIQGEVVSCTDDLDQVELKDQGCLGTVSGCQSIPGGTTWISEGMYVMVIGEVMGGGNVKAVKIVDLSDDSVYKTMWEHEVAEAKAVITENPDLFT